MQCMVVEMFSLNRYKYENKPKRVVGMSQGRYVIIYW